MGKLAERLADPARAGVYRVESTEALEEAAALAGCALVRLELDASAGPALDAAAATGNRVILLSGFEHFFRGPWPRGQALVAALTAEARTRRSRGECFFVAFLDPGKTLPQLPPLYKWAGTR